MRHIYVAELFYLFLRDSVILQIHKADGTEGMVYVVGQALEVLLGHLVLLDPQRICGKIHDGYLCDRHGVGCCWLGVSGALSFSSPRWLERDQCYCCCAPNFLTRKQDTISSAIMQ